jgi:hypothetical protein
MKGPSKHAKDKLEGAKIEIDGKPVKYLGTVQ